MPRWIKKIFSPIEIEKSYNPFLTILALNNEIPVEQSVYDDVDIVDSTDIDDHDSMRRAIASINNYYNVLGIYRKDFDKGLNDKLAKHPYFIMIQKAILDYMTTIEFEVIDKKTGERVDTAQEFIERPNPQMTFQSIVKPMITDLIRYDAGVWVKTFNKAGYLVEVKPYLGTEFWIEPDRVLMEMTGQFGVNFEGFWTHGYVKRYWQRSVVGIYIPFHPEEICYFMMYPKSDDVYGTDFLSQFRSYIQFLIDSTRAAGVAFHNNLVPSMILTHPEIATTQQLMQRISEIESHNKGSSKVGNVLHLVGGESAASISNNLIDMQWLEGQKYVGQLIWSTWGFPASEFIDDNGSKAGAYIRRNITKSKMLYPLLKLIEDKVNTEILPFLKGYKKTWKFNFIKDLDLDDSQKIAQTTAINATSYTTLIGTGMKPSIAAKISRLDTTMSDEDLELIDEYFETLDSMPMAGSGVPTSEEMMGETDMGRYGEGSEMYQPIDFNYDDPQDKKESVEKAYIDDRYSPEDIPITKGRIYIQNPSEAPKGREVRRGLRGGYYYVTSARTASTGAGKPTTTPNDGKKRKKPSGFAGGSSEEQQEPDISWQPPEPKELDTKYEKWFAIQSDSCYVLVYVEGDKLKGYSKNDKESQSIVSELKDQCDTFECMSEVAKRIAKEKGYNYLQ